MRRRTKLQILGCLCIAVSIVMVLVGKGVVHSPRIYEWYHSPTGRTDSKHDWTIDGPSERSGPTVAGIVLCFGLMTLWIAKDVKW